MLSDNPLFMSVLAHCMPTHAHLPPSLPPHTPTQVAQCYPEEISSFPDELQLLLRKHAPVLEPTVRLVRLLTYCFFGY